MSARRCSQCGHDWPDSWTEFRKCPQCLKATDRLPNEDPMDADLAKSLKSHLDFERYYDAREAKRQPEMAELEASMGD